MFNFLTSKPKLTKAEIIHKEFKSYGENLVKEAQEIINRDYTEALYNKSRVLESIGFVNNETCRKVDKLSNINNKSKDLLYYYNKLNQNYKVIDLKGVLDISKKYKLCINLKKKLNES